MITINGKTYQGNNLEVRDNEVYIDGKRVSTEGKVINIVIDGNLNTLKADACNIITVIGNVYDSIQTKSGNIQCQDVQGSISTTSGDIVCTNVTGNAASVSGDIKCETIHGDVKTVSGDIKRKK